MDVLNIATLSNCSLTSQNLHNATLANCTLRNAELHNSTITASTFHSCRLYDCTIHTSIFHKSSIFGAKYMLKCQFNGTDIRASLPELQKLPVEVREMIFKETLEGCWNGKAPSLLVALRGHPDLYFEALAIFRKRNTFRLNRKNGKIFEQMPDLALGGIRNLDIEIPRGNWSRYVQYLSKVKNLVLLHISVPFTVFHMCSFSELISSLRDNCGRLESLTLSFPHSLTQARDSCAFLDKISKVPGVRIGDIGGKAQTKTWVWKAEAGKALEWRLT